MFQSMMVENVGIFSAWLEISSRRDHGIAIRRTLYYVCVQASGSLKAWQKRADIGRELVIDHKWRKD